MIAMSAPPSPVPTAAPANPAGPADPQATPAAGPEESGAESTPFAAVLGKQMKAAKGDEGKAEPTAKAILVLTENAETSPAADTLSIIASMLAGIAPPPGIEAKAVQTDTPESDPAALLDTGEEAAPGAVEILAAPVVAPNTTAAPATARKEGEASIPDAALPRAADKPAVPAAIVAAEARAKAETAVETAATKAEPNRFDALLDAASRGQAGATNIASHAAPPDHANAANRTLPIATPVGAHGWDREVGEKVTWMASRQQSHAELVLNPPQLGRVEVSLSISGDQATATFVSASPAVREALENAIPQLRETLQGAGISLGQAQVGAESFQQAANQRENGDNSRRGDSADVASADSAATGAESTSARWLRGGNGLVDTFA